MPGRHPFPNSPEDKHNATAQARYLADLIQASVDVELTEDTVRHIRQYLYRVGQENYEDLVASVFLECWSEYKATRQLTNHSVCLAADRVRQRLLRTLHREVGTANTEVTPSREIPPDEEVALVLREFQTLLQRRSLEESLLFQRYYLDGKRDVPLLAEEFGLSPATIYRKLNALKNEFLAIRDLKNPPDGTD